MNPRDAAWAAGVFAGALAVLCYGLGFGIDFDVAVAGGDRVWRGDRPYRDFWTLYAPGSSAAVAATFALFGRELIAVHAVAAAAGAAATAAWFRLLRTAGLAHAPAVAASALFVLAVWQPSPPLDSYALALPLLLVGWERVLRSLGRRDSRPLLAGGLALGAAALFKHDVAGHAVAGSALALTLARWPAPWPSLARLALGVACFAMPAALSIALFAGADAWQDLFVFPARDFAVVRGESYPGWLAPAGALASLLEALREPRALPEGHAAAKALAVWGQAIAPQALMLLWAVHALARRPVPGAPPTRWLAVACLPFFWAAAHVQQNTHLFTMAALCGVLVAELWVRERSHALRAVFALPALLLAVSLLASTGLRFGRMQLELRDARVLDVPGTRGIRVSAREHAVLEPIADWLRNRVPPGQPIHLALGRHDAVVIGDPRFYFLADRPPATRYHELHPGVVDRAPVQREIIDALERQRVRAVVVWNFGWPDAKLDAILAERRRARPGIGARLLDLYLRERFERVARFGEYDVLWRDL